MPRRASGPSSHDPRPGAERGDLSRVPLSELLSALSNDHRTGVLAVATARGVAEVRLTEGQIFDAVYRRLEGEKALYRLLDERDGAFTFTPGGAPALRRVDLSTTALLEAASRQSRDVSALKRTLAPAGDAILATEPASTGSDSMERELLGLLQAPRSVDEVLDETQSSDIEALKAMHRLCARGLLRRIPRAALTTRLAPPDQMPNVRMLAARLARDGFAGPPRIAFASSSERLAALAGALLRIEDVSSPTDPPPTGPLPHPIGIMRLGDSVELLVLAIPICPDYAPTWALMLPGTSAVVRLEEGESPELDAACHAAEIDILDAGALLGEVDVGDPTQLAELLRSVLEAAVNGV